MKKYFDGKISAVTFSVKEMTFVCLPAFQHFIFIARTHPNDKTNIRNAVQSVATQYLKEQRAELQEDIEFDSTIPSPFSPVLQDKLNINTQNNVLNGSTKVNSLFNRSMRNISSGGQQNECISPDADLGNFVLVFDISFNFKNIAHAITRICT